uniref:Uncharacterized protein n=1 Tax=Steinernema glaseri TaxID=37863 RepID=A0A1I8ASB1_9BILA
MHGPLFGRVPHLLTGFHPSLSALLFPTRQTAFHVTSCALNFDFWASAYRAQTALDVAQNGGVGSVASHTSNSKPRDAHYPWRSFSTQTTAKNAFSSRRRAALTPPEEMQSPFSPREAYLLLLLNQSRPQVPQVPVVVMPGRPASSQPQLSTESEMEVDVERTDNEDVSCFICFCFIYGNKFPKI